MGYLLPAHGRAWQLTGPQHKPGDRGLSWSANIGEGSTTTAGRCAADGDAEGSDAGRSSSAGSTLCRGEDDGQCGEQAKQLETPRRWPDTGPCTCKHLRCPAERQRECAQRSCARRAGMTSTRYTYSERSPPRRRHRERWREGHRAALHRS